MVATRGNGAPQVLAGVSRAQDGAGGGAMFGKVVYFDNTAAISLVVTAATAFNSSRTLQYWRR